MNNFLQRLTMSGILSTVLLVVIYFSNQAHFEPVFFLLTTVVISGALWEYYQISKVSGCNPVTSIGIVGSIIYLYMVYLAMSNPFLEEWPLITLALLLFTAFLYYFFSGVSPFPNLAVTIFGVVYITIPLSAFIPIDLFYGRYWMFYLLIVTKMTDVGAYFVGKQLGRHQLAPQISPKKTWEGAVAGFLTGVLASYALHKVAKVWLDAELFTSSLQSLWFGALMSIAAQLGDLSESLLKRASGMKDSNRLPGLGGLLDMVDSLVFTTPLLYFFLKLFWRS